MKKKRGPDHERPVDHRRHHGAVQAPAPSGGNPDAQNAAFKDREKAVCERFRSGSLGTVKNGLSGHYRETDGVEGMQDRTQESMKGGKAMGKIKDTVKDWYMPDDVDWEAEEIFYKIVFGLCAALAIFAAVRTLIR